MQPIAISIRRRLGTLLGALAWSAGGLAAATLHGYADLGSQALPLVLAAALASVWWPTWAAAGACAIAALAFNWFFVAPRGSFNVSLHRDALLLFTMLAVSVGVTLLMARQRKLVALERRHAERVEQLHALSEALRQAEGVQAACEAFRRALDAQAPAITLSYLIADDEAASELEVAFGKASGDEKSGLQLCVRQGLAMGPGTRRYENQAGWYLPMRGLKSVQGAALLRLPADVLADARLREHMQALCDLVGQALERMQVARAATRAEQAANAHAASSTMLAAISHDYRTPLAAILSAASSLSQQGERLNPQQRQRLADNIVDEASQLNRLTDNALQLTRLGAAPEGITRDWESVEELVGAVLRRVRARDPVRRVRARLAPELPLLRCDGVLLVQMLENLIDNALKYSPTDAPVEILCRRQGERMLLAVRDRGPGIPPAQRSRLFQAFERGDSARLAGARGAGVGLALCQAVARAHGAELKVRARGHGGSSMEVLLAVEVAPEGAGAEQSP